MEVLVLPGAKAYDETTRLTNVVGVSLEPFAIKRRGGGQFGIVRVQQTGVGVNSELPAFNGRGRGTIRNRPARLLPPARTTQPTLTGMEGGCTWVYMGVHGLPKSRMLPASAGLLFAPARSLAVFHGGAGARACSRRRLRFTR